MAVRAWCCSYFAHRTVRNREDPASAAKLIFQVAARQSARSGRIPPATKAVGVRRMRAELETQGVLGQVSELVA